MPAAAVITGRAPAGGPLAVRVPLWGVKAAGRVAVIDYADRDLVGRYRWHVWEQPGVRLRVGPYAVTTITTPGGRRLHLSMHKLITGWAVTDHANHEGLDNRRSNLRYGALNDANRRKAPGWSSRYKGVSWAPRCGMWRAQIGSGGRTISLGVYRTETAAARAYDRAALRLWGAYACLNFPGGSREWHTLPLF